MRWTIASQYQYGLTLLSEENYTRAREHLVIASEYEDTEALIQSCDYAIAIKTLEDGDYTTAITMLEELGEYEDVADYIDTAKDARKYEFYKDTYQDIDDTTFYDTALATIADLSAWGIDPQYAEDATTAEARCSWSLYGTWYTWNSGENLVIDASYINGREYALEYVQTQSAFTNFTSLYLGYFIDNPTDKFAFFIDCDPISHSDYSETMFYIYFFEVADGGVAQEYQSVTQAQYQSLQEGSEK